MIELKGTEGYFAFLRERYRVLLRRCAGEAAPWTQDPVLRAWRFCNVRREDDRVTAWFRENIRNPLRGDSWVFFATVAFRWFNTEVAGRVMMANLLRGEWDREWIQWGLEREIEAGAHVFTGAFMVNSAPGKPKHVDVLDNIDWVYDFITPGQVRSCVSHRSMFELALTIPRLGNFAAYQVVADLQHTDLLADAPDRDSFTVAGPGCAKGIGLAFHEDAGAYNYGRRGDQTIMLSLMREALALSREPENWPEAWPPFILSDIENGFCEYAKWRSGHAGARLKRKFTPTT